MPPRSLPRRPWVRALATISTLAPLLRTIRPAAAAHAEAPTLQPVTPQITFPTEDALLATLRPGHPRLLLLPEDVDRIRTAIETDPTARAYHAGLRTAAEKLLTQPVSERVLIGPRLLAVSRAVLERVYTLALLYRLDGDPRWADRATAEMRAAAAFKDWNPTHFLDVAEMSHALAIGYDWLFDVLPEDTRATIRQALVEKGLRQGEAAYKQRAWWAQDRFNWNNVCNGGLLTAALCLADEQSDLARFIAYRAISGLPKALDSYAPDGAWAEGPGYWNYATQYTVLAFTALQSALGTDFGLSTSPGFPESGLFRLQSAGPTRLFFNFADAGDRAGDEPSLFWLAKRFESPLYAWGARDAVSPSASTPSATPPASINANPRDLLWYDPRGTKDELAAVSSDALFSAANLVFMRSAWADPRALYIGFKGGDNKANHSHLDLGTFVLDALGQRWAIDLGPDDYDLPGYFDNVQSPASKRWTYYRLRTEGHNTLTLDGQNQDPKAAAPIIRFASIVSQPFAIADLTAAYLPSGATRVHRGLSLLDNRTRVLIQDELEAAKPVDVRWAMHTRASISIGSTPDTARLILGGSTLEARLIGSPGAYFQSEEVTIPSPQRPAPGTRRLIVRLPDTTQSARIAVLLTPVTSSVSPELPAITPLATWA